MKSQSSIQKLLDKFLLTSVSATVLLVASGAMAQTLQCVETNGVKIPFLPQVDGGWDVKDSRQGIVLADDFPCNTAGPISDIHIWGSWLFDQHGTVTNFWIGIYSDVPAVTNFPTGQVTNSHPGVLLWQQSFGLGQYSENPYGIGSELFYNPTNKTIMGNDTQAWYYCFYPTNPFVQQGTAASPTNYWLAVYAQLPNDGSLFGWKTTQVNYNDSAVWGTHPGGGGFPFGDWQTMTNPQTQGRINLSFKLTTPTNQPCCPETNGVKWIQRPNLFNGIDFNSTQPFTVADDFKCTNSGVISDIHLWGSWLSDRVDVGAVYTLAIWGDVPVSPGNNFSHPGNLLWKQDFVPGNYTICPFTNVVEQFHNPDSLPIGGSTNLYYLCFFPDPASAFKQTGTPNISTNYWLSVTVQPSAAGGGAPFGWKSSLDAFNDIAVWSPQPFPPPATGWNPILDPNVSRVDLAFKITTVTNTPTPPCCPDTNGVKYLQRPNVINGVDIDISDNFILADDFPCTNTGPITDIHLWGSWLFNNENFGGVTYTLTIWSDVPVNPVNTFSHPGSNLWSQTFGPGQYTICPYTNVFENFDFATATGLNQVGSSSNLYYLCFFMDPAFTFTQTGTPNRPTNYWLSVNVQAPVGTGRSFGWKTSLDGYNDGAVWGSAPPLPPPTGWNVIHDNFGNKVDLSFKITTATNTCPTIFICQPGQTNECGSAWSFSPPVVLPNTCCPTALLPTLIGVVTNESNPCRKLYTATWQITNCSGAVVGTCSQTVTVQDTTPPVITCVSNKTVECGSTWSFDKPTAIDACCGTNVTITITGTVTNSTGCSLVVTRTWQATDCCNNSSFCSQTVTVVDTTPPVITCSSNKTVPFGLPWTFDPPTAVDQCCGTNVSLLVLSTATNGIGCNLVARRVWAAIDCCNNTSATCTQIVTVVCCLDTNGLKYVQWPNLGPNPPGYDVWNSSSIPPNVTDGPWLLADDFICTNTGYITDIHLWGSWRSDQIAPNTITFWLALFDDVSTNANNPFSHPGRLVWSQCFAPGQYAEAPWSFATEYFLDPGPPSTIIGGDSLAWYYCFYPTNPPIQRGTPYAPKTYWLAAFAQLPSGQQNYFGWKTTTNVQHDISVHTKWQFGLCPTNLPQPLLTWVPTREIEGLPLDLAFQLTTATNCASTFLTIDYPATNIVVVTWPYGILQVTTNLLVPFVDVPGAKSPYTNTTVPFPPTNRFYRVRCP